LQVLYDEALAGRCYTAQQFGESFEGQAGLGGERTIRDRVSVLSTQGYIKFFREGSRYGLAMTSRSKYGYLCVEDMRLRQSSGPPDPDSGEINILEHLILPTHYKCPQTGALLPVENPNVWLYQDEETT
jgi:putative DNA primase/helicase